MLGTVGSIASLAGLAVSLLGLGFAILQLRKLRGETRAAREASESAERAVRRDLTATELTRLYDRIQELKVIHRRGDNELALYHYPIIILSLADIRRRHPNLTDGLHARISDAIDKVANMERTVGRLRNNVTLERAAEFNDSLTDIQSELILELQERLPGFS